jgi:membrane dipeptidase
MKEMNPMTRREAIRISAASLLVRPSLSWSMREEPGVYAQSPKHWPGYAKAIVIDALGGPGGYIPGDDGTAPLTPDMVRDARESGITAVNLTVGPVGNQPDLLEKTFRSIAIAERELSAHPETFMKTRSAADLRSAKAQGKMGLIYGFQDGAMLENDLSRLDLFFQFGLRIFQPTYNQRNLLGDGCLEEANSGLSKLGRSVVEHCNDLGVLVDLSHCGQRTTAEGIAASRKPVAITHSGCAAIADRPRNKHDEELRSLAQKGGVFGVYLMPFLRMKGQPTAEDVIQHLEHAIQVCGEDHVGIGTDGGISSITITPEYQRDHQKVVAERRRLGISAPGEDEHVYNIVMEYNTPNRLESIALDLLKRGHSEARVAKIVGGNFARLLSEVWKP